MYPNEIQSREYLLVFLVERSGIFPEYLFQNCLTSGMVGQVRRYKVYLAFEDDPAIIDRIVLSYFLPLDSSQWLAFALRQIGRRTQQPIPVGQAKAFTESYFLAGTTLCWW